MDILEILKSETQILKEQYLKMTEEWAVKEFETMKNSPFLYLHTSGKYFKKVWGKTRSEDAKINSMANTLNRGSEEFVSKAIKNAEIHYETATQKLAERIKLKDLDMSNLKVLSSYIGVNINTTLTDGVKTVRAFTIVASGEIQKPHYRYLIK